MISMLTGPNGREPRNPRALEAASNVIHFPIAATGDPYSALTAQLVIERFRQGTLPEAVVVALLSGAGLRP